MSSAPDIRRRPHQDLLAPGEQRFGKTIKIFKRPLQNFFAADNLMRNMVICELAPMADENFYLLKAAQFRIRAQTEHDIGVRWAMEALIRDYTLLAEGRGAETALAADFETPMTSPLQGKQ